MKTYLEQYEILRLREAASNLRDRLLIRLLFHLGCRVSEALAIAVDDMDLAACTVTIQHLKTRLRLSCPNCGTRLGKNNTFCSGCGVKVSETVSKELEHRCQRTLPIDSQTLAMLKEYVDRGGPVLKNGKKFVFGINRHRAWQIVRDCAVKAGLPKLVNPETGRMHHVSPHKLRDGFAIVAVKHNDSGDGLRLLQEQLGHQSIATTMRYRKVAGEELKTWYAGLWKEQDGR